VQADVPVVSALYAPATHTVHTADVLAVPTLLYHPAAHAVQADVPVVSALYAPATHRVQTTDVVAPGQQRYAPAAHAVQPLVPVDSALYDPAGHAAHTAEGLLATGLEGNTLIVPAQPQAWRLLCAGCRPGLQQAQAQLNGGSQAVAGGREKPQWQLVPFSTPGSVPSHPAGLGTVLPRQKGVPSVSSHS
jgi:hypothetical protein